MPLNFLNNGIFPDNAQLSFGTDGDLVIKHDGSNSKLENNTGHLYIINEAADKTIYFQNDDGSGGVTNYIKIDGAQEYTQFDKPARMMDNVYLQFGNSNDSDIYHNGTDMFMRNYADDGDIRFYSDDGSGGIAEYFRLDGGIASILAYKDILMANDGNDGKIKFGASQDLEIYHDGSHSRIDETGTGGLIIRTGDFYLRNPSDEEIIYATSGGAVNLYYDNSKKFETTTNGATITGGLTTTASSDIAGINMTADIAMGSNDITDSNSSAGTAGQVLSSLGAGNGTDWIDVSGTISGSGVNNRLVIWSGTTTITSDSDFYVDGDTIFTDNLSATGNISIGGDISKTSGDLTLDVAGDITLDADGNDIRFSDGGTQYGKFKRDGGNFRIYASENNKDLEFLGEDDGSTITALTLDMSDAGTAIFGHHVSIPDYVTHYNDASTRFGFSGSGTYVVNTSGTTALTIDNSQAATFVGDIQAAGIYVGSTNTGYDFYNNGTSYFNGAATVDDTFTQTGGGASSFSGDVTVANLYTGQYVGHSGDGDTYIQFQTNRQTYVAGNIEFIDFNETTQDYITIGNSSDVDTKLLGGSGYIFIQGSDGYIGVNDITPTSPLDINANTAITGTLNVSSAATFAGTLTIPSYIIHNDDTDTYLGYDTDDSFVIHTGGSERLGVNNSGLKLGNGGAIVTTILDEDNMASDSATALATQQSIKAYVDNSTTGVLTYQGTWNADTNSPTLSSGSGTPGYYYIVSVPGSTDLDGITDWAAGDWAVFSDLATDAWQKIDNTAVGDVSVGSGAVSSRVSYWSGSTTIAGTAGFTFDGSNLAVPGNITIGGSINKTGDLTLDVSGDINVDAGGGDIKLKDDGVSKLTISMQGGGDTYFVNETDNADILFKGVDDTSTITALTLDMSNAGSATFNDDIDYGGKLTQTGTTANTFNGDVTFTGDTHNVMWDKSENRLEFWDNAKLSFGDPGGTPDLVLYHDSADGNSYINDEGTGNLLFQSGGSTRFSIGGDVGVIGSTDFFIPQGRKFCLDGVGGHTYIEEESDSNLKFYVAGSEQLNITDSSATFTGTIGSGNINISDGTPVLTLTDTSSSATVTHTLDGVDYQIANNGTSGNFKLSRKVSTTERVFLHAHDNGNLILYGDGSTAQTISGANTTFAGTITGTSLYVGRDSHNYMSFETDNQVIIRIADSHRLKLTSAAMLPYTDSSYDLGSTDYRYTNIWVDNINGGTPTTGGPYLPLSGGTVTGNVAVTGTTTVGDSTDNGAVLHGSKAVTLTENTFTTTLTVVMSNHTACYVKIFVTGDWNSHSSVQYLGEYFLANSAGSYNEPGMIIREVDNTNTDSIVGKIVDPSGTSGNRNFVIQLKADDTVGSNNVAAKVTYEVMGQYVSVS